MTLQSVSMQLGPMYIDEKDIGQDMRSLIDAEVRGCLYQAHSNVTHMMVRYVLSGLAFNKAGRAISTCLGTACLSGPCCS